MQFSNNNCNKALKQPTSYTCTDGELLLRCSTEDVCVNNSNAIDITKSSFFHI